MASGPEPTIRFREDCVYGAPGKLRTALAGSTATVQERCEFLGGPVLRVRLPDGEIVTALPAEVEEIGSV